MTVVQAPLQTLSPEETIQRDALWTAWVARAAAHDARLRRRVVMALLVTIGLGVIGAMVVLAR